MVRYELEGGGSELRTIFVLNRGLHSLSHGHPDLILCQVV
jgi:hypothetical protein